MQRRVVDTSLGQTETVRLSRDTDPPQRRPVAPDARQASGTPMEHLDDLATDPFLTAQPATSHVPVLVVDDDAAIRETLRLLLEDAGYDVLEASDGHEGLGRLAQATTPLVVVLDLMMPLLDGQELLRRVEEDPQVAHLHHFILITATRGGFTPALTQRLERLGIPVLRKPFDLDVFLDAVTDAERRISGMPWSNEDTGKRRAQPRH